MKEFIDLSLNTQLRVIKKLSKTTISHDLGYRPIISLHVERIKGKRRFPFFVFHAHYISDMNFHFYHEPYSREHFRFVAKIIKETVTIEEIDTKFI